MSIRDLFRSPLPHNIPDADHKKAELRSTRFEDDFLDKDRIETSPDEATHELNSIAFSDRVSRDLAIDRMNPEETLPKFIRTEDQIPDFKPQLLTMDDPSDGAAMDQVNLVQTAFSNFVKEENKYNQPHETHYFNGSNEYRLGQPPRGTNVKNANFLQTRDMITPVDL